MLLYIIREYICVVFKFYRDYNMDYIEVLIKILPFNEEIAECLTAELAEIGFESFVTEEPNLKCYIQKSLFNQAHLKCVISGYDAFDGVEMSYETSLIMQQNWNVVWESQFDPIVIDDLVTIKAPFHKVSLSRYNIKIEPKMAFGTGHHQTTTMMVKALLALGGESDDLREELQKYVGKKKNLIRGVQVLDMGCGTGVLALLAAKLGAKRPVHAIDVDITAVNSAKENAWKNRLHNALHILGGDASLIQANKYDIILANINRNILLEDMSTYSAGVRSGGFLVVSGFYKEDIPTLDSRAAECGFAKVGNLEIEGWGSVIYVRG